MKKTSLGIVFFLILSLFCLPLAAEDKDGHGGDHHAFDHDNKTRMPDYVKPVEHDPESHRETPKHKEKPYDPKDQVGIYGGKYALKTVHPLITLGRRLYGGGLIPESWNIFGSKNPTFNRFLISGDFLVAVNLRDDDLNNNGEFGNVPFQINLDIDWKITGTERIHMFIRPLRDANNLDSQFIFEDDEAGGDANNEGFDNRVQFNPEALFLEGDLGQIIAGITGEDAPFDLAFAVGLIRLFFQNGIWVDDFFTGAAFTIPALNSPLLDISNMDITFFMGLDEVDSDAIAGNENDAKIFGVTAFIEAFNGYWELGYGYTYDRDSDDDDSDFDYHSLTAAFSRRYGGVISNSIRVLWNFGQDEADETANGVIVLVENSFITHLPSTLIPYANFFVGFNKPVKLAGNQLLLNTGINFESDFSNTLTRLDNTGQDVYGGAIGVEYLFGLDQQIVVEVAFQQELEGGDNNAINADNDGYQLGFALRYQLPISNATILRVDGQYSVNESDPNIGSVRFEIRRKF